MSGDEWRNLGWVDAAARDGREAVGSIVAVEGGITRERRIGGAQHKQVDITIIICVAPCGNIIAVGASARRSAKARVATDFAEGPATIIPHQLPPERRVARKKHQDIHVAVGIIIRPRHPVGQDVWVTPTHK